jgi:hypothetical protein
MQIHSQAEYENALLLIQDLSGAPEDTPEERLLIRLVLAVEIWKPSTTWRPRAVSAYHMRLGLRSNAPFRWYPAIRN